MKNPLHKLGMSVGFQNSTHVQIPCIKFFVVSTLERVYSEFLYIFKKKLFIIIIIRSKLDPNVMNN